MSFNECKSDLNIIKGNIFLLLENKKVVKMIKEFHLFTFQTMGSQREV